MKKYLVACVTVGSLLFTSGGVQAVPTEYGDTGLLTQPTAETLNAGNICVGVWGNNASAKSGDAIIVPVAITLGLGSFLEAYGSYPNLLFNDEEIDSGRGYANLGGKMRIFGKRSSRFKIAIDGQAQRYISNQALYDGLTDIQTRGIISYKGERFGVHVNGGYIFSDSPKGQSFEDQTVYGGGIEIYPLARLRMIAEAEMKSERVAHTDSTGEATFGFQYFVSPHFTVNVGGGVGLTDLSPDWRVLVGFSACQGIGTYQRPIPKLIEPAQPEEKPEKKPKKVVKIKTLTPLVRVAKPAKPLPVSPVSKLEVPVEKGQDEVVIYPSEQLTVAAPGGAKALAMAPVEAAPVEVPAKPVKTVVYRKFSLPEVTFGFDQSSVSAEGGKALSEIAEQLRKDHKWFVIRFDGFTDSTGSTAYNDKLSLKRAISTGSYLVLHDGYDPRRIFVKGFGESNPVASNDTPEGRSENRRVEILVLVRKE